MADFWYRCALAIVPRMVYGLIRLWFATCRVKVRGDAPLRQYVQTGKTGIAVFWHYSFLFLFYYFRKFPSAIMVSASKDGEYIARLASLMGHVPVRGSSHRGGVKALKEMIERLRQGLNGAIVADGSQGPARQAQAGCILMASKTGLPIFPVAWAARRVLIFNSWDRTAVPLPFTTIVVRHGEPLWVEPGIGAEQVEAWRLEVEQRLNRLYEAAWHEVGRKTHDGGRPGADRLSPPRNEPSLRDGTTHY
ncbi:MAG: lysophospholipid acyltransferase family protein [Desulfobulbus sp.]|uniref:lysophospholipid acyltransferase family protein n=1 Tax=Desulfobulbus sp. TaxID=895 RepID=UPI0028420F51|nr:lysophospholipid acyltransferase family protein [Desulfobulbus sp.]MDR2550954.1 lysophospholipid acyltransferase family protein [Desulfobulbus sp.]